MDRKGKKDSDDVKKAAKKVESMIADYSMMATALHIFKGMWPKKT